MDTSSPKQYVTQVLLSFVPTEKEPWSEFDWASVRPLLGQLCRSLVESRYKLEHTERLGSVHTKWICDNGDYKLRFDLSLDRAYSVCEIERFVRELFDWSSGPAGRKGFTIVGDRDRDLHVRVQHMIVSFNGRPGTPPHVNPKVLSAYETVVKALRSLTIHQQDLILAACGTRMYGDRDRWGYDIVSHLEETKMATGDRSWLELGADMESFGDKVASLFDEAGPVDHIRQYNQVLGA